MGVPVRLPLYLTRAFGGALALILAVFLALGLTGELIELARRAAGRPELGFATVALMAVLKLPALLLKLLPFGVLFAAMLALYRLDRHRELIAVRAAGQSAWGFLAPILAASVLLGLFAAWLGQPASSLSTSRFQDLEQRYFKPSPAAGLWLRLPEAEGWSITRIRQPGTPGEAMRDISILRFDPAGRLTARIDAERGRLLDDGWHLEEALLGDTGRRVAATIVPTSLTAADLLTPPGAARPVPVWALPGLIAGLEAAGLPALRQRLDLQAAYALPFLLAAAALLAAPLTLPRRRLPGMAWPLLGGLLAGFVLLVFSDATATFGASGGLPVILAAWAPVLVAGGFGTALLLHMEGA